jgi:YegS/Rv2252/BmrU family lipid kinase
MAPRPEDGYIAYIVNPKSGASSGKIMVRQFKDYLTDRRFDIRTVFTTSLAHASASAANAGADPNCSIVVAAGGDGTVREIVHGLEATKKPLLIIPCGTENLLANELGFDERTKTLINAFESGPVKPFDLGKANGLCFTSVAGFGFDGEVVKRVAESRRGHINHLDYFWPIWRTFWGHKFPRMNVTVDGKTIYDGRGMVFVGNISRYAIGLQILHDADYGDGLLDVCIYICSTRRHLVKHAFATVTKLHSSGKDVVYTQGKVVRVESPDPNVFSQFDGDPGPSLPMNIEIIPQAANMVVPPNAKPAGIRTRLVRMLG